MKWLRSHAISVEIAWNFSGVCEEHNPFLFTHERKAGYKRHADCTVVHIDDEVTARTAKASVAFGRLRTMSGNEMGSDLILSLKSTRLLYCQPSYMHVGPGQYTKHNHFHLSCLRKILKIRWQDKIPDTEVLKKAKMQSVHILLKLVQLRWSQECLMSSCQRKFSMENCKKESAHKVAKRNATKTPLKPRLRISIIQLSPGNRLLRIEQSGVASSTKVPPNLKQLQLLLQYFIVSSQYIYETLTISKISIIHSLIRKRERERRKGRKKRKEKRERKKVRKKNRNEYIHTN